MRVWFSCLIVYFVDLVIVNTKVSLLFRCPPSVPIWMRRAEKVCNTVQKYHCLYDFLRSNETQDLYVEKCIDPKKYAGVRCVYSGNLDAKPCQEHRFSPFPNWSYKSSFCPFGKSLCNEEGQIAVDDGTSSSDRSCRCNYRDGYSYIVKPKDPCRCNPMKEDCSCYIHTCQQNESLSADKDCKLKDLKEYIKCNDTVLLIPRENEIKPGKNDTLSGFPIATREKIFIYDDDARRNVRHIINIAVFILMLFVILVFCLFRSMLDCSFIYNTIRSIHLDRRHQPSEFTQTLDTFQDMQIVIKHPSRILRKEPVTLQCNIQSSSSVEKITWYHEQVEIRTERSEKYDQSKTSGPSLIKGVYKTDSLLTIKDVHDSDSGNYNCKILFKNGLIAERLTSLTIPKKIFWKEMPVVPHYHQTKQIREMHDAFEGENRKNLVILKGMHGSGKTQAAHYFCKIAKEKYSIVEKISFREDVLFNDVTKIHLGKNVEYRIPRGTEITHESILEYIKECFNHKDRKGYPYLLFIDNVDVDSSKYYNNILGLVAVKDSVPNLDIILATTDETFIANLSDKDFNSIDFNGMEKDEYINLFKSCKANEDDISKLVEKLGNSPLVLVAVAHFLKTTGKDLKTYLDDYCSDDSQIFRVIDNYAKKNSKRIFGEGYDIGMLMSQEAPLQYLKKKITEDGSIDAWTVMTYVPFLRFDLVSSIVLEAVYYHRTKCHRQIKKEKIDLVVQSLSEVSFCYIAYTRFRRMRSATFLRGEEKNENDCEAIEIKMDRTLSFHRVPIFALELYETYHNRNEMLMFLLKLFCYEIDIDARTDITVSRNMLFVRHARKLLRLLDAECKESSNEINLEKQFYISYLHCGIGSTLLFERSNVADAHKHLMIAKRVALGIVKDQSYFAQNICSFQETIAKRQKKGKIGKVANPDIKQIKKVYDMILKQSFSTEFVSDFMVGKRRNPNDIDVIKTEVNGVQLDVFTEHYLSLKDLEKLQDKNRKLALPLSTMREYLLIELIIRILHNNGRALNELKYTISHQESSGYEVLKYACHAEYVTALEFCRLLKDQWKGTNLFGVLECDRSGRMLLRWSQNKVANKTMNEDIKHLEDMLAESTMTVYDFGIVKLTHRSNIRHTALCRRILLRYLMRKYKESRENREYIYCRCESVMKTLQSQLREMECNNMKYTWLTLPLLYIQCGKCLLLGKESDVQEALKCFENALNVEKSREVFWTRFTFEGYKGKISCLRKQNKREEALCVTEEVITLLSGKNRDEIEAKFKEIKESIVKESNLHFR